MADQIVASHSITSATGWWVTADFKYYEPIAVWALVDVINNDHPTLGTSRKVVGLKASDLDDLSSVDLQGRSYDHESVVDENKRIT